MPSNKQFGDGVNIREAYSASHLSTLLVSNQHAVDLTDDGCERLLSVMDEFDCLHCITNNWDSMARENLGSSGDTPNYYAIGTINIDVSTNSVAARRRLCCSARVAGSWRRSADSGEGDRRDGWRLRG